MWKRPRERDYFANGRSSKRLKTGYDGLEDGEIGGGGVGRGDPPPAPHHYQSEGRSPSGGRGWSHDSARHGGGRGGRGGREHYVRGRGRFSPSPQRFGGGGSGGADPMYGHSPGGNGQHLSPGGGRTGGGGSYRTFHERRGGHKARSPRDWDRGGGGAGGDGGRGLADSGGGPMYRDEGDVQHRSGSHGDRGWGAGLEHGTPDSRSSSYPTASCSPSSYGSSSYSPASTRYMDGAGQPNDGAHRSHHSPYSPYSGSGIERRDEERRDEGVRGARSDRRSPSGRRNERPPTNMSSSGSGYGGCPSGMYGSRSGDSAQGGGLYSPEDSALPASGQHGASALGRTSYSTPPGGHHTPPLDPDRFQAGQSAEHAGHQSEYGGGNGVSSQQLDSAHGVSRGGRPVAGGSGGGGAGHSDAPRLRSIHPERPSYDDHSVAYGRAQDDARSWKHAPVDPSAPPSTATMLAAQPSSQSDARGMDADAEVYCPEEPTDEEERPASSGSDSHGAAVTQQEQSGSHNARSDVALQSATSSSDMGSSNSVPSSGDTSADLPREAPAAGLSDRPERISVRDAIANPPSSSQGTSLAGVHDGSGSTEHGAGTSLKESKITGVESGDEDVDESGVGGDDDGDGADGDGAPVLFSWGQGLVAFERKDEPGEPEETSPEAAGTSAAEAKRESGDAQDVDIGTRDAKPSPTGIADGALMAESDALRTTGESDCSSVAMSLSTSMSLAEDNGESDHAGPVMQETPSDGAEESREYGRDDSMSSTASVEFVPPVREPTVGGEGKGMPMQTEDSPNVHATAPSVTPVEQEQQQQQQRQQQEEEKEEEDSELAALSKEQLLNCIHKVDREIANIEQELARLRSAAYATPDEEDTSRSIQERVLEANKAKAVRSHDIIPPIEGNVLPEDLSSLELCAAARAQHEAVKSRLGRHLGVLKKETALFEESLTREYVKHDETWKKKLRRIESDREANPLTHPVDEQFRRQRDELLEPASSVSGRGRRGLEAVRSEQEFMDILQELRAIEAADPNRRYLKTIAVIPPLELHPMKRSRRYFDNNRFVPNPENAERQRKAKNAWTDQEKQIFIEKYCQYPKNFAKIARYLKSKDRHDCVWFYYTHKKTLNLKAALEQANKRAARSARNLTGMTRELAVLAEQNQDSAYWMDAGVRSTRRTDSPPPPKKSSSSPSVVHAVKSDGSDSKAKDGKTKRSRAKDKASSKERAATKKAAKRAFRADAALVSDQYPAAWTAVEERRFRLGLRKFGRDFKHIADFVGTKSQFHCHHYFLNFKDALGLEAELERYRKSSISDSVMSAPALGAAERKDEKNEPRRSGSFWTPGEKEDFVSLFKKFGRNWKKLAEYIPTKTENQIKNFYQNYKVKLNLQEILEEFAESTGTPIVVKTKSRKGSAKGSAGSSSAKQKRSALCNKRKAHPTSTPLLDPMSISAASSALDSLSVACTAVVAPQAPQQSMTAISAAAALDYARSVQTTVQPAAAAAMSDVANLMLLSSGVHDDAAMSSSAQAASGLLSMDASDLAAGGGAGVESGAVAKAEESSAAAPATEDRMDVEESK